MGKYDYSRFKDPDWTDDWKYVDSKAIEDTDDESVEDYVCYPDLSDSTDREYWGIHEVDGRLEIDIRRFEYACYRLGEHGDFPEELRGKGDYYISTKESRHDYVCNYLKDSITNLKEDWDQEYKPLFKKIFSPKDAEDSYRTSTLAMFGDSDFYDDIELGSKWAAFDRMKTYYRIQAELHCVFITKVVIEIHRIILRALSMELYENTDYSIRDLITYCNAKAGVKAEDLVNWNVYTKYNTICNFLKHNSRKSYDILKRYYPECLVDTDEEYENGMFATPWLNFKNIDVEQLLKGILPFLMDFCIKVLGEDPKQAEWDYDGRFIEIFNELKDPWEHLGIYGAAGMSPWS